MLSKDEIKKAIEECEAILKFPYLDWTDARYVSTIMDTLGWVLGRNGTPIPGDLPREVISDGIAYPD